MGETVACAWIWTHNLPTRRSGFGLSFLDPNYRLNLPGSNLTATRTGPPPSWFPPTPSSRIKARATWLAAELSCPKVKLLFGSTTAILSRRHSLPSNKSSKNSSNRTFSFGRSVGFPKSIEAIATNNLFYLSKIKLIQSSVELECLEWRSFNLGSSSSDFKTGFSEEINLGGRMSWHRYSWLCHYN